MATADEWAAAPQQRAAVERARRHIAKRTAGALASDLGALRDRANAADEGVLVLEARRRRGDVDLGPQSLPVHAAVVRARGAEWLLGQRSPGGGLSDSTRSTCQPQLSACGCDALLEWLYTGACTAAADMPAQDLDALYAVAVVRKMAGLTEQLGELLRSNEAADRRSVSAARRGGRAVRGRGHAVRGRGRGARRDCGPESESKKDESVTASERSLCEDMHRLFAKQEGTDCVLLCPSEDGGLEGTDARFSVHRVLLAARSEYFRARLSTRWHPAPDGDEINQKQELTMAEPPEVVAALVDWIYGSLAPLPTDRLPELATAAEYYGLSGLQSVVALSAKLEHCHLFMHTPCELGCGEGATLWLQLAEQHGLRPLRTGCIRWLARHYRNVWPTRHFACLPEGLRAAVAEELQNTLTAEVATARFLEAGGALSGGVASGTGGDWSEGPLRMLTEARDAALRIITTDFMAVARTVPFIELCSGVGWQEHLVVDEIAPALGRVTTRANRQEQRTALVQLARAVMQEGLCPACDQPLAGTTSGKSARNGTDSLSILECGHIFHSSCYSPFRSTSCASCQVEQQTRSPRLVQDGRPNSQNIVQDCGADTCTLLQPSDADTFTLRAAAQNHPAIAALLSVLGDNLAPQTLSDICAECGDSPHSSDRERKASSTRSNSRAARERHAGGPPRRNVSSGPSQRVRTTQAGQRDSQSNNDQPSAQSNTAAGDQDVTTVVAQAPETEPGWLRGTTKKIPPTPDTHWLGSPDLTSVFGGGISATSLEGGVHRGRSAEQNDARRHLLRARRGSAGTQAHAVVTTARR